MHGCEAHLWGVSGPSVLGIRDLCPRGVAWPPLLRLLEACAPCLGASPGRSLLLTQAGSPSVSASGPRPAWSRGGGVSARPGSHPGGCGEPSWATALNYRCRWRSSCRPGPVLCARLLTCSHRARALDQRQLGRAPRSLQPFPGGSRGSAGPPAGPLSFPEPRSFGPPGSGLRGSAGPGPSPLVQPRLPRLPCLGGTGHLPAASGLTAHGEQEGGGGDTAGRV